MARKYDLRTNPNISGAAPKTAGRNPYPQRTDCVQNHRADLPQSPSKTHTARDGKLYVSTIFDFYDLGVLELRTSGNLGSTPALVNDIAREM